MSAARHFACAATLVGLTGTLAALSPGLANAGRFGMDVLDCSSGTCTTPTTFVVGQSYTVNPPYDGTDQTQAVNDLYDNGGCIGSRSLTYTWVPLTTGTHTLTSHTYDLLGFAKTSVSITVTVVAAPAGAPTPHQPQQGGCGGGGSFGSGSSNLRPGS
ncbi:hypothetical protein [Nocardia concava]|uniref:hypothetical protein n=1 Tax=Nocardia concava TaxID=257281 RepID=UPI0002FD1592|nr:hypothetical protein [Nocardia concava]